MTNLWRAFLSKYLFNGVRGLLIYWHLIGVASIYIFAMVESACNL